jgi:DNA-binding response OmpR family regulator
MARILIAEDDPDIREMVETKLSELGYETVAVADGEAAMRACVERSFDLAVLDIMMPGMSGLETLRLLRANEWFAGMPIVVMTALTNEYDVKRGYETGASVYLTKPFSLAALAERIQELLSARSEASASN